MVMLLKHKCLIIAFCLMILNVVLVSQSIADENLDDTPEESETLDPNKNEILPEKILNLENQAKVHRLNPKKAALLLQADARKYLYDDVNRSYQEEQEIFNKEMQKAGNNADISTLKRSLQKLKFQRDMALVRYQKSLENLMSEDPEPLKIIGDERHLSLAAAKKQVLTAWIDDLMDTPEGEMRSSDFDQLDRLHEEVTEIFNALLDNEGDLKEERRLWGEFDSLTHQLSSQIISLRSEIADLSPATKPCGEMPSSLPPTENEILAVILPEPGSPIHVKLISAKIPFHPNLLSRFDQKKTCVDFAEEMASKRAKAICLQQHAALINTDQGGGGYSIDSLTPEGCQIDLQMIFFCEKK